RACASFAQPFPEDSGVQRSRCRGRGRREAVVEDSEPVFCSIHGNRPRNSADPTESNRNCTVVFGVGCAIDAKRSGSEALGVVVVQDSLGETWETSRPSEVSTSRLRLTCTARSWTGLISKSWDGRLVTQPEMKYLASSGARSIARRCPSALPNANDWR